MTALMAFAFSLRSQTLLCCGGLNDGFVNNKLSDGYEPGGAIAVFHFDGPDIGIEALLALEQIIDVAHGRWRRQFHNPSALARVIVRRSGGGTKEMTSAVEMIDDDVDGACLLGTFTDDGAIQPLNHATAQEGTDPDAGL